MKSHIKAGSTPTPGTTKTPENQSFSGFLFSVKQDVSPRVSLSRYTFRVMEEPKPRKYKLARLVIPAPGSKDQRWVIKFRATTENGVYQLFRETEFNSWYPDLNQRKDYCDERIKYINKHLKKLATIVTTENEDPEIESLDSINFVKALDKAIDNKVGIRKTTRKNYTHYKKKYKEWLVTSGFLLLTVDKVNKARHVDPYIIFLFKEGLGNRTINNHIEHMRTVLSWIPGAENHFLGLETYETEIGRNIAYNEVQIKEQVELMQQKAKPLLMACKHMYYTLMRPNEMSLLKVGDIGAYHSHQIAFNAEISKNKMYRNVTLPLQYEKELLAWLSEFNPDPDDYLFGRGFTPGKEYYPPNRMADSFRERVRKKLGYSDKYTFYSWKHTGVVRAYLSGMPVAYIRMQTGHQSNQAFEEYLKSLGLFENIEVRNNYPEI